jgi:hypothetical protein
MRCANRPGTRLHLTGAHISSKNVLLSRSHPHRTFKAPAETRNSNPAFAVGGYNDSDAGEVSRLRDIDSAQAAVIFGLLEIVKFGDIA